MAILPPPPKATRKGDRGSKKGKPVGPRFLITISVLGSAGPIRVVVTEGETVTAVIAAVLRSYAREGRLPALGSAASDFLLYCAGSEAMSPEETISSKGSRSFVLCRRDTLPLSEQHTAVEKKPQSPVRKDRVGASWKSWVNKSLSFKISSH